MILLVRLASELERADPLLLPPPPRRFGSGVSTLPPGLRGGRSTGRGKGEPSIAEEVRK
jgi:hypothetical protein